MEPALRRPCLLRQRALFSIVVIAMLNAATANKPASYAPLDCAKSSPHSKNLQPDVHLVPPASIKHGNKRPPYQSFDGVVYFSSSYTSVLQKEPDNQQGSKTQSNIKSSQTIPPDAFPYLSDIGLRHRLPFKSGMARAGDSWDDAGLRPNVNPRISSGFRPERQRLRNEANVKVNHQTFAGENRGRLTNTSSSTLPVQHNGVDQSGSAVHKWALGPEDLLKADSDDMEAEATADEWSMSADASSPMDEPLAQSVISAAVNGQTGPKILRWSSHLLNSGKHVWKWLKSNAKDKDGIALTMLKPKVHRPVVASLPLIPNDSKRDFVYFLIGTFVVLALLVTVWNSRVTPEEYFRAKKAMDMARRSPRMVAATTTDGDNDGDLHLNRLGGSGDSSSYPRATGGRRRPRAIHRSTQNHVHGAFETLSDEESDAESLSRSSSYQHHLHPLLPASGAEANGSPGSAKKTSWLFSNWFFGSKAKQATSKRRRSSIKDDQRSSQSIPMYSDHSRSNTPRTASSLSLLSVAAGEDPDSDFRNWQLPTSQPRKSSPSSTSSTASTNQPSGPSALLSNVVSSETASALLSKTPFRSLTPQPQTQRQRERDRSRERHRAAQTSESTQHEGAWFDRLASVERGDIRSSGAATSSYASSSWSPFAARGTPLRTSSANSHRSWSFQQHGFSSLYSREQESRNCNFTLGDSSNPTFSVFSSGMVATGSPAPFSESGQSTPRAHDRHEGKRPAFRHTASSFGSEATSDIQQGVNTAGHPVCRDSLSVWKGKERNLRM